MPTMRALIGILKEATMRLPKVLYHCTLTANLPDIQQNGLRPDRSQSSSEAIYLAAGRGDAENYACMRPGQEHILLAIATSSFDLNQVGPDDYELRDYLADHDTKFDSPYDVPWQLSLKWTGQVTYTAWIPATAISVIKTGVKC